MSSQTLTSPVAARVLVTLAALGTALLVGTLLVRDPRLGATLVGAVVFVPIAFLTPPLALSGWLVAAFLSGLPGIGGAANRALLVIFLVWIGSLAATRTGRYAVRQRLPQVGLVVVFLLWLMLSLIWAPVPENAQETVTHFLMAALVFLMVVTFVTEPKHARWLAFAFVTGCVLSVLSGIVTGGLSVSDAGDTSTSIQGRFQGGSGDPNYLAAAIVPAMMLAAALAIRRGRPILRLGLMVAIVILAVGLAATQSRGGFIAIAIVSVGALVLWRGRRMMAAAMIVIFALGAIGWFTASPAAWERITSAEDGGSGRTDIWTVAWRVVEEHPVVGVGLTQFPVVSQDYLRQPGAIERGDLIINHGIVVHNAYLQLWAETGLIGLLLFAALALRGIAAAQSAATRFEGLGDTDMATLSRAAMLALIGALTASFFLSNVNDQRFWVLLAFGPALLAMARRMTSDRDELGELPVRQENAR
jgi:O-antigen ligase